MVLGAAGTSGSRKRSPDSSEREPSSQLNRPRSGIFGILQIADGPEGRGPQAHRDRSLLRSRSHNRA